MQMIEKIARALARDELTDLGRKAFDADVNYYLKSFPAIDRNTFERKARVMLEALKEPTKGMIERGRAETVRLTFDDSFSSFEMKEVYNVIIDAALKTNADTA